MSDEKCKGCGSALVWRGSMLGGSLVCPTCEDDVVVPADCQPAAVGRWTLPEYMGLDALKAQKSAFAQEWPLMEPDHLRLALSELDVALLALSQGKRYEVEKRRRGALHYLSRVRCAPGGEEEVLLARVMDALRRAEWCMSYGRRIEAERVLGYCRQYLTHAGELAD